MGIVEVFSWVLGVSVSLYVIMILVITVGYLSGLKSSERETSLSRYFRHSRVQDKKPGTPTVSIIIPVRNEMGNITSLLEELSHQDYPSAHLEIIIADDFSEDYTIETIRKWMRDHGGNNVILAESGPDRPENYGKKRAIERGLEKATGELVLSTDADSSHGPSWVSEMARVFSSERIQMVLGPVGFSAENSLFQKVQCLEFLGIMGTTAGSANLRLPLMCNGANLAYRRQAFQAAEGFSGNQKYHSGDDQFLMMKFRKQYRGGAIRFLQERKAVAWTAPSGSWHEFLEQRVRWVSKSRGYRDPVVLAAGLLTYGQFVMLMAGLIAGVFYPVLILLTVCLWLIKILAEYPLVWLMAGFFGKKKLLKYYFIAQVFQFVYVIFTGFTGQFSRYSWKGRNFRR